MKSGKKVNFIFVILISILISACSSTPEEKIDSVFLMVYDYDNTGVMDAVVYLNDKLIGRTDIYGRFMFPVPSNGKDELNIRVEKTGFEKNEINTILQAGQVLYFKIGSASYYADNAERYLDEGNYEKAQQTIEKALSIENRADYRFLKTIIQKGIKNEN